MLDLTRFDPPAETQRVIFLASHRLFRCPGKNIIQLTLFFAAQAQGGALSFTVLPCWGTGLYAHARACASGTFRFLPSRFTQRRQIADEQRVRCEEVGCDQASPVKKPGKTKPSPTNRRISSGQRGGVKAKNGKSLSAQCASAFAGANVPTRVSERGE